MRMLRRIGLSIAVTLTMLVGGLGLVAAPASASPSVVNIGVGSPNFQGVYCIQQALNIVAGAGLAVDGQFGPATKRAVENFQRFFGLSVDGIVGKDTGGLLGYTHDLRTYSGAWRAGGCWNYVPSHS